MRENAKKRQAYYADQAQREIRLLQAKKTPENLGRIERIETFIQNQLEKRLDGHKPHFARLITFLQAVIIGLMMYFGDIAPWGFGTYKEQKNVQLLAGNAELVIERPENPYYGPEIETLVRWGSKWPPCMREDDMVDDVINDITTTESTMGCCTDVGTNYCGQMTAADCGALNTITSFNASGMCANTGCEIKLRPCCFGIIGQCAVVTEDHCDKLSGIFLEPKRYEKDGQGIERCSQSDCIYHQCGMGFEYHSNKGIGEDQNPNQFYRFVSAVYLHIGLIHYAMNALAQYVLVAQIEEVAGFWRTLLMYNITGWIGFMISALFSEGMLSNGSSAAIYGMLGVETVDLFQTWQILDQKYSQLFWLFVKLIIFLGIGTLPYIDNFAHVGGFFAGISAGFWLLPYMVFSRRDELKKLVMKMISSFVVVIATLAFLYIFYTTGSIDCSWCHYINCINYSEGMCDTTRTSEDDSSSKAADFVQTIFTSVIGPSKW